ncbi:hypothetical protein J7J13_02375 [bacterium]|nr:hypothetical protein [bacterium]
MNYELGKNFEGALAINKKPKKENPTSRIVVENFGNWSNFRRILKDARENVDYNPLENKFSQRRFTREILQSNTEKINADDFKKLSYLITKEIKELERREEKAKLKSQEKEKTVKEKYIQRDMPFSGGEKERSSNI